MGQMPRKPFIVGSWYCVGDIFEGDCALAERSKSAYVVICIFIYFGFDYSVPSYSAICFDLHRLRLWKVVLCC